MKEIAKLSTSQASVALSWLTDQLNDMECDRESINEEHPDLLTALESIQALLEELST